ncbi:MAG: hydrogenase formation protein HypD [Candidatus Hadarchaeales archaeon]
MAEETIKKYRDRKIAEKITKAIKELAPERRIKIMHVCGSHERTIAMYGLRDILPESIEVISGPGCPVCCTPVGKIDEAMELARRGIIVTTFGDMLRVPGTNGSLSDTRSEGGDVRVVYSISDAVEIARNNPEKEVVHMAVGFETTAPSTAATILSETPENFSVLVSHLLIPPAMDFLMRLGETKIDGFICPGHVSTIIGSKPYEPISHRYGVPQVIAGFEPVDVLLGVLIIIKQLNEKRHCVEIEYTRSVRREGNQVALDTIQRVFRTSDKSWRGFPKIPDSALEIKEKYSGLDAEKKFEIEKTDKDWLPEGCRCGEVLRGIIYPWECPLFNKTCTPERPVGPCAVSSEGACNIAMRYGGRTKTP